MHKWLVCLFLLVCTSGPAVQAQSECFFDDSQTPFVRGDFSGNGVVTLHDLDLYILWVQNNYNPQFEPLCYDAADVNDDGQLTLVDLDLLYDWLAGFPFAAPAPPFPDCGPDPTETDAFSCAGSGVWCQRFNRGDANDDGLFNVADMDYIANYLYSGGPWPPCQDAADANDDGMIDVSDINYIGNWLFSSGPMPPSPSNCGRDCTFDSVSCDSFTQCSNFPE